MTATTAAPHQPPLAARPKAYTITITALGRPPTINAERSKHHQARARIVREWRGAARLFWRNALPPNILRWGPWSTPVTFTITPLHRDRRSPQDAGACAPAAKAAIDALHDIGALADDGPAHVAAITYTAPIVTGAVDGLQVTVHVPYT